MHVHERGCLRMCMRVWLDVWVRVGAMLPSLHPFREGGRNFGNLRTGISARSRPSLLIQRRLQWPPAMGVINTHFKNVCLDYKAVVYLKTTHPV